VKNNFDMTGPFPQSSQSADAASKQVEGPKPNSARRPSVKRHDFYWLASALKSAADSIVIVNSKGEVQFLNPAAERLTGWLHKEAHGHHFSKILFFQHAGSPLTDDLIRLATLNEESLSLGPELSLITKNGRWRQIEAEISASTEAGGQSGSAIFTFRDITLRKWEEHQNRQEHAIRAVERLAESTTHALNNQLTSILGHGELLLNTSDLTSEQRELAGAIHSGAMNVAEVVRHLSAISRTKFVTRTEIDINDVVRQILPVISGSFSREIVVKTELAPDLGRISADRSQLEQVLFAILSNAQESLPESGPAEIVIATQPSTVDAPERLRAARNFTTVKVRDTGVGMSRETCDRIFEPFFTTKKTGGHIGLGLCITQGIIRDYHGFVDVVSNPGTGTEVTFGIPTVEEDGFAYLDEPAVSESAMKTVLIVEDDHAVRHLLRKVLERNGYHAVEARDGEDAMLVAELHAGRIDVLLTDIAMPGMSGPDLVRHFAGLHPEAKFLLISGFSPERMGPAIDLPRGVDFLQKPFKQGDLLARIESLLANPIK